MQKKHSNSYDSHGSHRSHVNHVKKELLQLFLPAISGYKEKFQSIFVIRGVILRALLLFFVLLGFFILFGKGTVKENFYNTYLGNICENFLLYLTHQGHKNYDHQEEIHKDFIDSRGAVVPVRVIFLKEKIDHFFQNILERNLALIQHQVVRDHFLRVASVDKRALKKILQTELLQNPYLIETIFYNTRGVKISEVQYRHQSKITLDPSLLTRLWKEKILLMKEKQNVALLCAIQERGLPLGFIRQTLHPQFYEKLIRDKKINDRLYYIKNSHGEIVVNNLIAYQKSQIEKNNFSFELYKLFTHSKEIIYPSMNQGISYKIGMVYRVNNSLGNLLGLLVILCWAFSLIYCIKLLGRDLRFAIIEGVNSWKSEANELTNEMINQEISSIKNK